MSREELERIIPVSPPKVKRKMNPRAQSKMALKETKEPYKVINHLKTLTPVGTAIIIVAAVK
jgi:hypothetical protein